MTIIRNDERSGVLDISIKITVKLYISKKEAMKHWRQIKDVLIIFLVFTTSSGTYWYFQRRRGGGKGATPPSTHTLVFTQNFNKYTDMEINLNSWWGKGSYIIPVHCSFLNLQFHDFGKVTFLNFFLSRFFEWVALFLKRNATCLFVLYNSTSIPTN